MIVGYNLLFKCRSMTQFSSKRSLNIFLKKEIAQGWDFINCENISNY